MRLCLSIEAQEGVSYERALALAHAAEHAGFDAALFAEHYTASSGRDDASAPEPWIYLAALARETQRIRLGTLVSPVTFRHPSVIAKLAATLDHVSGGRAELGLGAGWLEEEHLAYGLPFASPARRVDLLEEQLQVVKGLWTEEPFNHAGPAYQLSNCRFTPKPVQEPHPPLLVGGRPRSRRIATLAGRYADEYVISLPTAEECRLVRSTLESRCRLSAFTYACVEPSTGAVNRRLAALSPRLRPEMREISRWIVGTPAVASGQLHQLREAGVSRLFVAVWEDWHQELPAFLQEAMTHDSSAASPKRQ